jgi:NAD(P)-dependent dehydrogenase (short-subunit alcohol dehydrogenase family)
VSAVLVTGGGTGIGAAVARLLREAEDEVARAALPFDPRVEVRPDPAL